MKCRQVSLGPTVEPQALTKAALESSKSATDVRKCFEREGVSPKKLLAKIDEPSHTRRFASDRGELPWPSLGLDTSTLLSFAF